VEGKILTVTELSRGIKQSLEISFGHVRLKGEISGFLHHASGHMYFALKDASSVIDCVCWRSQAPGLSVKPADGMEVVCEGKVTTYAMRSKYQIVIHSVQMEGAGAILKMLEERKKKLKEEGLFDQEHKKSLPAHPCHIAVLTSPTGAVIRDILHRVRDRYPCYVRLWPVVVQGPSASESVIEALDAIEKSDDLPDLIIIARGGGSVEDLLPFSDELLVRRVFNCSIPVVSAIGHETDITLLDYVADVRAPTPTGAAEIALPNRKDLLQITEQLSQRCARFIAQTLAERLMFLSTQTFIPQRLVEQKWMMFDDCWRQMVAGANLMLQRRRTAIERFIALTSTVGVQSMMRQAQGEMQRTHETINLVTTGHLKQLRESVHSVSRVLYNVAPQSVMSRGYAVVKMQGKAVMKAQGLKKGDSIDLTFLDGKRVAHVTE